MKKQLILQFLFALFALTLQAQCDSVGWYFTRADTSYKNPKLCLQYSLEALPLLQECDTEKYIYTRNGISYCYKELGDVDNYDKNTKETLEKANELLEKNHVEILKAKLNRESFFINVKGDFKGPLKKYKAILQKLMTEPILDEEHIGVIHNNIADLYRKQGDFQRAIEHFLEALNYYKGTPHSAMVATQNLAKTYLENRNIDKAIQTFHDAEIIIIQEQEASRYLTSVNRSLASAYLAKGDTDQALQRLAVAKNVQGISPLQNALNQNVHGQIFQQQGKHKEAIIKFKEALTNFGGNNKVLIAETQYKFAESLFDLTDTKQAAQYNQKAIKLLIDTLDQNGLPPPNTTIHDDYLLLQLLAQKARIQTRIGEKEAALQTHQSAFRVQQQYQRQLFDNASKLFRNKEQVAFHDEAMALVADLYSETKADQYIDLAFEFAEGGKASILLEEIKTKEAENFSSIPESLRDLRYSLLAEISFLERKIKKFEQQDDMLLSQQKRSELLLLKTNLDDLERQIRKDYPAFNQIVDNTDMLCLDELQASLDPFAAFIEYYLTENALYTIYIDRSSKKLLKTPLETPIHETISKFLAEKTAVDNQEFKRLGLDLYQQLIGQLDIPKQITHLRIIPHKYLAFPFAMLPSSDAGRKFKEMDFLLHRFTCSYAYSASVLQTLSNPVNPAAKEWLGMAPFSQLDDLAHSEEELHACAQYFEGENLLDKLATKVAFLLKAPNGEIIHLSTHADAYGLLGEPYIRFHGDSLFLSELYTLRLQAAMVVLSACETNLGHYEDSEGIMSLSRGFTYAGASSLLATQWEVNDQVTSNIMQAFYQRLDQGMAKDEALRLAQLDFLEENAQPYYWAGFTLLGDVEAIKEGSSYWWWFFLLIGVGVLLVMYFLRKKAKVK